jgi:hypothetical protein
METHAMSDSPSYPGMIMVIRHGEKPGASGDDKAAGLICRFVVLRARPRSPCCSSRVERRPRMSSNCVVR